MPQAYKSSLKFITNCNFFKKGNFFIGIFLGFRDSKIVVISICGADHEFHGHV
jgi:hypothetical protein